LSLTAHPIGLVRQELAQRGVLPNEVLKHARAGTRVSVSGLVLVRQRPSTANGVVFMTIEDETGIANLIVRPTVWDRCRSVARMGIALIADGVVERDGLVVHVMVNRFRDVSEVVRELASQSRDFH
jgi:error-prone DNA polymerase